MLHCHSICFRLNCYNQINLNGAHFNHNYWKIKLCYSTKTKVINCSLSKGMKILWICSPRERAECIFFFFCIWFSLSYNMCLRLLDAFFFFWCKLLSLLFYGSKLVMWASLITKFETFVIHLKLEQWVTMMISFLFDKRFSWII